MDYGISFHDCQNEFGSSTECCTEDDVMKRNRTDCIELKQG